MANTVIQLKKSIVPGNVPSSLENGEIAINTADGILFYKDPSNVIKTIRTDTTTNAYSVLNVNSSLLIATSNSDILSIDSVGAITLTPDSINDKFTIGVKSATTSIEGVVQLYDGLDSVSTSYAATANTVKNINDFIGNLQNVDLTQNTNISSAFIQANSAYEHANTRYSSSGGVISGNVSINGELTISSNVLVSNLNSDLLDDKQGSYYTDQSNIAFIHANSAYNLANTYNGLLTATIIPEEFTATQGQTTFTISNGYNVGNLQVYVNGVLLDSDNYTANNSSTVIIDYSLNSGDEVTVNKWGLNANTALIAFTKQEEFIASNNQTVFNTSNPYETEYLSVFRNGILLEKSEYTANGGTLVTLDSGVPENDIIVLQYSAGITTNTSPYWIRANAAYATANSIIDGNAVIEQINLPEANLSSNLVITSTNTANQVLDLFSTSKYRSIKYLMQVTSGTEYQASELLLLHNGTNSYITEYGLITTGNNLISFDSDISSGNVRLLMTPINNVNQIKFTKTSITV